MKDSKSFAIVGGIIAIIIGIAIVGVASNQQSDIETGTNPIDITDPNLQENIEIQEKLENITKTVEKNKNTDSTYDPDRPREWISSGPFQIDREQYALGENIFIRMGSVPYEEKGQIAFLRPLNQTHYSVYITIPFDGTDKGAFNQYFKPALSKAKGICTIDDIVGEWRAVFRGTNYNNIEFSVTDKIIVPGEEENYEPIC